MNLFYPSAGPMIFRWQRKLRVWRLVIDYQVTNPKNVRVFFEYFAYFDYFD